METGDMATVRKHRVMGSGAQLTGMASGNKATQEAQSDGCWRSAHFLLIFFFFPFASLIP